MKWTEERVRYLQQIMHSMNVLSLDATIEHDDDDDTRGSMATLGDLVASTDTEELIDEEIIRETLSKFVSQLKPRELKVIMLRYGLEDGVPKTLQEVGDYFGVTRERIRQLELKAIHNLRRMFEKAGIHNRDDI